VAVRVGVGVIVGVGVGVGVGNPQEYELYSIFTTCVNVPQEPLAYT
jgi:hypothetical protein